MFSCSRSIVTMGLMAIFFGLGDLVFYGAIAISQLVACFATVGASYEGEVDILEAVENWALLLVLACGILALLGLVLILSGCFLFLDVGRGIAMLKTWSYCKVIVGIVAVFFQYRFSSDLMAVAVEDSYFSVGLFEILHLLWISVVPIIFLRWALRHESAPLRVGQQF